MIKKIAYAFPTVAGLAMASLSMAAVDTEVLDVASTTVNTLKDNIMGVLTANIGTIAVVAAAIVGIMVIYRLLRRIVK